MNEKPPMNVDAGPYKDGPDDMMNYDADKQDTICRAKVCEYDWVLEERHSMTWRTFDDKKGKLSDYQIIVDDVEDKFDVITNTFRPKRPYDKYDKKYKDPNNHLSQIFTTDGRPNRFLDNIQIYIMYNIKDFEDHLVP